MRGSAVFRTGVAPGGVLAGPWVKNELWRRARAVPSLDLRFADNKSLTDAVTGQSLVTFTRASSGTYVGSDGLIRTATTNLLLRSQELATSPWFNAGVTIANNSTDVLDPVGGSTSTKIVATGTGSAVGQGATISSVSTGSIWLRTSTGTANFSLIIYLSSSPFTNIGTANITVTTTWQRFSVTSSAPASAASYNLQLQAIPATTLYAWGAQLEQSSTVGEYIPTTSTINSAPRFDHNPTTGESLGLLVEEQRTNLLLQSNQFDTTWTNNNSSETASAGTAPDGTNTAWELKDTLDAVSTAHALTQTISFTTGVAYTFTCWMKAGTLTQGGFALPSTAFTTAINCRVNLVTGAVLNSSAALASSTTLHANGWIRVTATATATATASGTVSLRPMDGAASYIGTGNGTILIWGAQAEAGAFPTSYIPTTTATVTRSADVASITGTNFSSWYRQDEGTVFADMDRNTSISSASTAVSINDNSTGNRLHNFRQDSASALTVISSTGGTLDGALTLTLVNTSTRNKVVSAQALNNLSCVANGATAVSDTSVAMPVVNQMQIGHVTGTSFYNGTIRRLVFWPQRLSNSTLQEVTR